ncbi:MAG: twin-arginine translocase TatA/TatE family subunit [Deltaproteobacteria bacterium]|jgi:Sec-independent protein translocase protein TatA|nr:twin-arginine translocase TatA/TatE family subunit [Deltaproteobacteria bacterium]
MFGLSLAEMAVILTVALIVLGPDKLPEVARFLARAYRRFISLKAELAKTIEETVTPLDPSKWPELNPRQSPGAHVPSQDSSSPATSFPEATASMASSFPEATASTASSSPESLSSKAAPVQASVAASPTAAASGTSPHGQSPAQERDKSHGQAPLSPDKPS